MRRPDDQPRVERQQLGFVDRFRRTNAVQNTTTMKQSAGRSVRVRENVRTYTYSIYTKL